MAAPHATPVACFIGASNLEEKLGDFTDEIRAGEHRLREGTVRFVGPSQSIRALCVQGMDGLCLSAVDMENKYYVRGTNGVNCKEGLSIGDSMFVYSLGK